MVDRYTKTMLTVIAVCLVYLSCKLTFPVGEAHAGPQAAPTDVKIVGVSSDLYFQRLPVEIQWPYSIHVWVDNPAASTASKQQAH